MMTATCGAAGHVTTATMMTMSQQHWPTPKVLEGTGLPAKAVAYLGPRGLPEETVRWWPSACTCRMTEALKRRLHSLASTHRATPTLGLVVMVVVVVAARAAVERSPAGMRVFENAGQHDMSCHAELGDRASCVPGCFCGRFDGQPHGGRSLHTPARCCAVHRPVQSPP